MTRIAQVVAVLATLFIPSGATEEPYSLKGFEDIRVYPEDLTLAPLAEMEEIQSIMITRGIEVREAREKEAKRIAEALEKAKAKEKEEAKQRERNRTQAVASNLNKVNTVKSNKRQKVKFTNYTEDGMSTGHSKKDFQVNHKGWSTYNGRVVVGAATQLCLDVKTGPCGKYNTIPAGFIVRNLMDTFFFSIDGEEFEAIVLDSCGACFWPEAQQRIDIHIQGNSFGTRLGEAY